MSGRYFVHAAVLLLVALAVWTPEDTLAALEGARYPIACIVNIETGGTYDPYSVGAAGEQGVIQLLPSWAGGGQWDEFWYGDWSPLPPELRSTWNPYQEIAYLEHWGMTHGWTFQPWSAWRYC